ncbi:Crp/Fnr family transcriptional regulator [Variovorax sp. N23]|jgi:CRP-like cAMP-binding protein|uniref:Crp/Fnr family transcriptional regulator n=1 Tax=Variovorax sp. N23 TaxID=2980555 RepID=UPI0021C671D5|nr:Crp/Fnr family transcriptional regulator [Variovorax sp. N23]MCU4118186.1 Crp/Fnr family transcriptional regulator [Variovorax sp. N23]
MVHADRGRNAIRDRARPARPDELRNIPWLDALSAAERRRTEAALVVGEAEPGDLVCRIGGSPTYWFGVVEGLLKMSNDNADGTSMTYSGLPPGGWFGEGTAMKREPYRYNIQALRRSVIGGLPIDDFHWLLDHSIGFNRFVMNQLNERLGQFIAAREADRQNNPDVRVARNLAALFNPVLFPGVGELLRITQQELAYLIGLSRQRVNEALRTLEAQGMIQVEYGGLRVLDLAALRSSAIAPNSTSITLSSLPRKSTP